MKILIADDTQVNIDAAQKASTEFPGHEFTFHTQAQSALDDIRSHDAIVSDLFFPEEDFDNYLYSKYCADVAENSAFEDVTDAYYNGSAWGAYKKLIDVQGLLLDGTIRVAVENLIKLLESWSHKDMSKDISKLQCQLENLPPAQFPFGGALILEAAQHNKNVMLVTDLHRHAGGFRDAHGSIDGMIILLPLIKAGIMTIEQATYDGRQSLTYMGGDEITAVSGESGGKRKSSPAVWVEAIKRVLSQE